MGRREARRLSEAGERRVQEGFAIEAEIAGLLDRHRLRLLELGAAGWLLIAGDIEEVLPLDDAELLDAAIRILTVRPVKTG